MKRSVAAMVMALSMAVGARTQDDGQPWRTDLAEARSTAKRDSRPCVILCRIDGFIL